MLMAGNKMGEQTREKILLAAEQEFLEKGYEKAKVEEIARRAGVTKVMLYYHFNTKQNIFDEIVKKVLDEIKRELRANLSQVDASNPEQFDTLLKAMLAFYRERRSILRLVISEYVRNGSQDSGTSRKDAPSLAVFNEVFGIVLELGGKDLQVRQREFLVRVFFFNALPMVMYSCLSDQFCTDFDIAPR